MHEFKPALSFAAAHRIILAMAKSIFTMLAAAMLLAGGIAAQDFAWTRHDAGTNASFRGLDVVDEKVVWASGTGGTVIRTIDGGKTWKAFKVPGAETLDFRDIEAFGRDTAYVLSIGNGASSRIYKTTDGGKTWKLQFQNDNEAAFFDSIAFWDEKHGIAQSDPVDGRYLFYTTEDGETWKRIPPASSPEAKTGEAAFAASGTCVITSGKSGVFLITGGTDARVLFSSDRGKTWSSASTPMIKGESATGIFGVAMKGKKGVIVGGDYTKPNIGGGNIAFTTDGGKTWSAPKNSTSFGYRSGTAFIDSKTIVVVGTSGSDISRDGGGSWKKLDDGNYNVVMSNGKGSTWAAGPGGLITKLTEVLADK